MPFSPRHSLAAVASAALLAVAGAQAESEPLLPTIVATGPTATAAVLVAMLAHVSGHRYGIEAYGTSSAAIRRSMARLLYSGVTGSAPPG